MSGGDKAIDEILNLEDVSPGEYYDAMVLYSEEDRQFYDDMLKRPEAPNFKFCTRASATDSDPAELVKRCSCVILVYSESFFIDKLDIFLSDLLQTNITKTGKKEKTTKRLIPCMYRECTLPDYFMELFTLEYHCTFYNFWEKMYSCLSDIKNASCSGSETTSQCSVNFEDTITRTSRGKIYKALFAWASDKRN